MQNFIESGLHGGVTTVISAGEVHLPGRPKDIVGLKALAIVAAKAYGGFRPAGVKVHGGAPILELGLEERDFAEMAAGGVTLVGEIGLGSVKTGAQAAPMVAWAKQHGMTVTFHTGGPVDRRLEPDRRRRRARGAAAHRRPRQRRHDADVRRRHRARRRHGHGDRDRPLRQRAGGDPRGPDGAGASSRSTARRPAARDRRQRRAIRDRGRARSASCG